MSYNPQALTSIDLHYLRRSQVFLHPCKPVKLIIVSLLIVRIQKSL